jgi:23S rRNA (uracil1939-C5)-methyltransferase
LTTAEVEWVETSDGPLPAAQVAHALGAVAAACDGVIGVVWTERRAARGVPTRRTTRLLSGSGVLPERLAAPGPTAGERRLLDLDVSPQAFFQPHPLQAEVLIARIAARLASEARTLGRGLRLADLYCGTGTLGLALSGVVARLVGVELVAEAVEDARRNAARNGIDNAVFVAGDVGQIIADPAFGHLFADLDAVIVDPPRAGLMPQAASHLARLTPRLIVYVSCNPAALARDLPVLAGLGYRLDGPLTPVDLFPQTHHVETLAFLVRSSDPAAGSAE